MIVKSPDLPPSPGGYDVDLPCAACRYNLRGLSADGVCPECGHPNTQSLEAWKRRLLNRPEPITSSPWVRVLADGIAIMLAGFTLVLVLAAAPGWLYQWRSPQRSVALGIACTAWVFLWYGTWKLTSPDPNGRDQRYVPPLRRLCRADATFFFLLPFAAVLPAPSDVPAIRYVFAAILIIPSLVCMLTAAVAYYLHLRSLAQRVTCDRLARATIVLGIVNQLLFLSLLLPDFGRADLLGGIESLPSCAFPAPEVLRDLLNWQHYRWDSAPKAMFSIVSLGLFAEFLLAGAFHLMILIRLRGIVKSLRAATATCDLGSQKNAANSPP